MKSVWIIETATAMDGPLYVGSGGSAAIAPWVFNINNATQFPTQAEADERLKALLAVDSKSRFTEAAVREHECE